MIWERTKQESLFISILAFYIFFWLVDKNVCKEYSVSTTTALKRFIVFACPLSVCVSVCICLALFLTYLHSFPLSISWSLMIFYYTCYSPVFTFHLGLSYFVPFSFFLNLFFITYFLFVFLSISCGSCFSLLGTLFLCCNLEF